MTETISSTRLNFQINMNDRELYGVIKALKEARYQVKPEKFYLKAKILKDIAEKFLYPYVDYDFFEVSAEKSPGRLTLNACQTYQHWRNNQKLPFPVLEVSEMVQDTTTVNISFEVPDSDFLTEYYILCNLVDSLFDTVMLQGAAEDQIALYYDKYGDENERTSRITTFMLNLAANGIYPIHKFIDLLANMGDSMPKKTMARVQNERQKFIKQFDVAEQFSL